MAFDRPIEADRVDDLGLFVSLIRAPFVWLLGGEHPDDEEEEEREAQHKRDPAPMARDMTCDKPQGDEGGEGREEHLDSDVGVPSSTVSARTSPAHRDAVQRQDQDKEQGDPSWSRAAASSDDVTQGTGTRPGVDAAKASTAGPSRSDVATEIMNDLVTALESNHLTSRGPASAVLSQSRMTYSSDNSLSASYSASSFSTHHASHVLSQCAANGEGAVPSHAPGTHHSDTSIRGSKTMSWSDEGGHRSLVEYFEDEPAEPGRSLLWSAMRRHKRRASTEGGYAAARREVRVIKSALRRSGSYSPPVASRGTLQMSGSYSPPLSAGGGATASAASSLDPSSSSPEMRSFRSISVIGSSEDCSKSRSSEHLGKASMHSQDAADLVTAATQQKINGNVGCGLASGGRAIPRCGPADSRFSFPQEGFGDARYQLILGTGVSRYYRQQPEVGNEPQQRDGKSSHETFKAKVCGSHHPSATTGRGNHHFLPGHISPQYGFYVNITPPSPELHAATNPLKAERPPRSIAQPQPHQQFQYQTKYRAPCPIPEGAPSAQGIPGRFVGQSSVPRPSSDAAERGPTSPKPSFTKNKKGMGMILAENPHNGVWPTVPFG